RRPMSPVSSHPCGGREPCYRDSLRDRLRGITDLEAVVSAFPGSDVAERRCEAGELLPRVRRPTPPRARRVVRESRPFAPGPRRPDRPWLEAAAAVRAHVVEDVLDAVDAERALVAADARRTARSSGAARARQRVLPRSRCTAIGWPRCPMGAHTTAIPSGPRLRIWAKRALVAIVLVGVLVLAGLLGAAVIPRWWSHRIGDQVRGSLTAGIFVGLVYGFVFTALPLVVLWRGLRRRRRFRVWGGWIAAAILLALPNLFTLGIVLGGGNAAHAGERT